MNPEADSICLIHDAVVKESIRCESDDFSSDSTLETSPRTIVRDCLENCVRECHGVCGMEVECEMNAEGKGAEIMEGVFDGLSCDPLVIDSAFASPCVPEMVDTGFREWVESSESKAECVNPRKEESTQEMLVMKAVTFVEELQKRENVLDPITTQPRSLVGGTLHPYQLQGMDWMRKLFVNGSHGLLADEMGLGKTIQVIGNFAYLRECGVWGRVLIVAPLSTLGNWDAEFRKWCPDIPVVKYCGNKEHRKTLRNKISMEYSNVMDFPVILTSYDLCRKDVAIFKKHSYFYVVIDEGHRLKNNECQLMQCLFTFSHSPDTSRLLLSGTPLQNNLKELWSLMFFLLPDFFSSAREFLQWFDMDAQKSEDQKTTIVNTLRRIISPFFLRRVKADLDIHLPSKKEVALFLNMTEEERRLYDIVMSDDDRFASLLSNKSIRLHTQSRTVRYQVLRQLVSHPFIVCEAMDSKNGFSTDRSIVDVSSKLQVLNTMLPILKKNGHRVLIFCQFTETIRVLEDYCTMCSYKYCMIDGSTSIEQREEQIDMYNNHSNIFVFLLSTRAGGQGINLSKADTVFIYDSDWNPHMDIQAMDRCHRLGQSKPVVVYRLLTLDTIDMQIFNVNENKKRLERVVVHHDRKTSKLHQLSLAEFLSLYRSMLADVSSSNAFITNEQAKVIASQHASVQSDANSSGYMVVVGGSSGDLIGSMCSDECQDLKEVMDQPNDQVSKVMDERPKRKSTQNNAMNCSKKKRS